MKRTHPFTPTIPHPWFAWRPVKLKGGAWVWFRTVWRVRRTADFLDIEWWEYIYMHSGEGES